MSTTKKLLEKQIEVFLEWTRRVNLAGVGYRNYLNHFSQFTLKDDILDINGVDVAEWKHYLLETESTYHQREQGRKALEALIRFYKARGVNGRKRETAGRPMDISGREQVKKYRKMGLKLREIEKLTGKHLSWVHRVLRRGED